jgi:hypothetical protein
MKKFILSLFTHIRESYIRNVPYTWIQFTGEGKLFYTVATYTY